MAIALGIRTPFVLKPPKELLDNFPLSDVSSVFSIRSLYAASNNLKNFRIRETGGNTEQDFNFSSGLMDQAAIEAFVGVNDGRLVDWVNQRDNVPISNSTASEQPRVAIAGSYVDEARFTNSSNEALEAPDSSLRVFGSDYTIFIVIEIPAIIAGGFAGILGQQFSASPTYSQLSGANALVTDAGGDNYLLAQTLPVSVNLVFSSLLIAAQLQMITITSDALSIEAFLDQVAQGTATFTAATDGALVFRIGAQRVTNTIKGLNIKEFISFTRELTSAEISTVETDIKAFYGI